MVADPVAGALLILGLIAVVLAGRLTEFTGWEIRFQALLVYLVMITTTITSTWGSALN